LLTSDVSQLKSFRN